MGSAVRFKTTQVPRQPGERARFKVVRGPDHGAVYVMTQPRATIGRGEESDIILSDLKASRQHAEVSLGSDGIWKLRDLNSSNGILYNGKTTKNTNLYQQDTLSIGETVLQFMTADQGTAVLMSATPDLRQVQAEQSAYEQQRKKIHSMSSLGNQGGLQAILGGASLGSSAASTVPQSGAQGLNQRKVILYALVGILAVMLYFDDENQKSKKGPANKTNSPTLLKESGPNVLDLKDYLPDSEPATIKESTQVLMKTGLREFWQGNWLRAKLQFETVLQIVPTHALARRYLQNCEAQIQNEVKWHLETGKQSLMTGKLKSARGHFEAVMRLLYRETESPAYKTANEQLQQVLKEMKVKEEEEAGP